MRHRLFVGIRPPSALRDALLDAMDGIEDARWQEDDQLHLTLRYIGETERHDADDLVEALAGIDQAPFELSIEGVGIFERKGRPHTLWAGIAPQPALSELHRRIERRCQQSGIEPEHRKFHPHVTLARLNRSSGPVEPFLARHAGLRLGPWSVESYILYESHLHQTGSIYEPVIRYSLEPNR